MSDVEMEVDQEDLFPEDDKENRLTDRTEHNFKKRENYLRLLHEIEAIQGYDEINLHVIQKLREILQEVRAVEGGFRLENSVQSMDENVLDANILNLAGDILIKCIITLHANSSDYDPKEFSSRLKENLSRGEEFQSKHLLNIKDAHIIVRRIRHRGSLYGAFDPAVLPDARQRKERKRTVTQEVIEKLEKKTPLNLANVENDEQSVDEIVSHQKKVLEEEYTNNAYQPISYYKFVIDTESFSATVENMFYFSFLIANGFASLSIDERNEPVIAPTTKKKRDKVQKNSAANVQMITAICEDDWKTFQIGTGFLQQRKSLPLENTQ